MCTRKNTSVFCQSVVRYSIRCPATKNSSSSDLRILYTKRLEEKLSQVTGECKDKDALIRSLQLQVFNLNQKLLREEKTLEQTLNENVNLAKELEFDEDRIFNLTRGETRPGSSFTGGLVASRARSRTKSADARLLSPMPCTFGDRRCFERRSAGRRQPE